MVVVVEMCRYISCRVGEFYFLAVAYEEHETVVGHVEQTDFTGVGIDKMIAVQISARVVELAIIIELLNGVRELFGRRRAVCQENAVKFGFVVEVDMSRFVETDAVAVETEIGVRAELAGTIGVLGNEIVADYISHSTALCPEAAP